MSCEPNLPHLQPDVADVAAWLRLTAVKALGARARHRLLARFGPPAAIFDTPRSALAQVIPEPLLSTLLAPPTDEMDKQLERTLTWLGRPNRHFISFVDPRYPSRLLTISNPPPVLYVDGDLALLHARQLAIVGSRNATMQGRINARQFARTLSNAGWTICSGLALGIDAAAHEGALEGKAGSVAVIGTGADRMYPATNRALATRLAKAGAIVSEFPLGTAPLAHHFPQRNRIISGLSHGVLIVEAAAQSGSLITARLAAEQGRDVYAIPGSIHAPLSRGCHRLIRQGALLVESPEDILEELTGLQWGRTTDTASETETDPILAALGHDPVDFEQIALRAGIDSAQLAGRLLELELAEKITRLPGERYQRLS